MGQPSGDWRIPLFFYAFSLDYEQAIGYFCASPGQAVQAPEKDGGFGVFAGDVFMTLMEILSGRSVIAGLRGRNKREILQELVDAVDNEKITDRPKVLEAVLLREEIMSTGIGHGIAIPHGKSEFVSELGGVLGIKREGVDFDALDDQPTFIFFLLVSPMDVSGPHIKALARISRLLKGEAFRRHLIESEDTEALITCIEEEEKLHS